MGVIPTPVLYFAFRTMPVDAAAMVTASHNPPEFNGLKLCLTHRPILPQEIAALARRTDVARAAASPGQVVSHDPMPAYLAWLATTVTRPLPGRLVVDSGGGVYAGIATRLLRELGVDAIGLYDEVDGSFAGRSPNPAVAANLAALVAKVRQTNSPLGVRV